MSKRISEKYNDACLKIFALLLLLSDGVTDFSDVIKLFADSSGNISPNSNVTLNKYLNTLKIFGVEVKKVKNKYYLLNMPFNINFTEGELYAVALIKSALNILPKGKNRTNIEKLINELQSRYDSATKKLEVAVTSARNYDLSFYFTKFEKQIENCERYCLEGNNIDVTYNSGGKDVNLICVPKEVKYLENSVCISVYNNLTRQVFDIPMDCIKSIKQLGTRIDSPLVCTTVIFKLKGDLIKRYNLREWEYTKGLDENGWLTIVNSGEDFNVLANRLFKYGYSCVVISPKSLRDHMINLINSTLENYE